MNAKARDVVTFFLGFAGIVHQTVVAPQPQAILVGAFVAMMFGPVVVQAFIDRWTR
jgi:hypothetical protein